MIKLVSVRLKNFRAVQDATFQPLSNGITGLSGPNGVGKSAFLEGTLWALYGEVPNGIVQSALRRQGASKDEECFVEVEFIHDGQTIKVHREMKPRGTVILYTYLDGKEATVTGVKEGNEWIKRRLGTDARGFTTAVLVRQKELDELVQAKPQDRRALIERLSGIDQMSEALQAARAEANSLKNVAQSITVKNDDLIDAENFVSEVNLLAEDKRTEVESAHRELERVRSEYSVAKQRYNVLHDLRTKVTARQNSIQQAQWQIEANAKTRTEILEQLEVLVAQAPDGLTHESLQGDIENIEETLRRVSQERDRQDVSRSDTLRNLDMQRGDLLRKKKQIELDKTKLQEDTEHLNSARTRFAEFSETNLDVLRDTLEKYLSEESESQNKVIATETSISTLKDNLDVLSDADECPTCHTNLHDASHLVTAIQDSIHSLEQSLAQYKEDVVRRRADILQNRLAIDAVESTSEEISRLVHSTSQLQEAIDVAMRDISELEESISVLEETHHAILIEQKELRSTHETLTSQRDQYREALHVFARIQDARRRLHNLDEENLTSEKTIKDIEAEIEALKAPSDDEYNAAVSLIEDIAKDGQEKNVNVERLKGELKVFEERLRSAESDLQRVRAALESQRTLLDQVAQKSAVVSLLDEFRKNQIARIAPELSETATELIAEMTNGHYVEVLLDENFTPSVVTADGEERPAAWLSGGELSVVALALRIAIGDLITGGEGGLLWLDEVLTAQDSDRRSSLIDTLRRLDNRQIVMINHTQGADDIVDKAIRLTRTEDGGTMVDDS